MFNLILGIVIGAAFSKFWLSLWEQFKTTELYKKITSIFK